MGSEVVKLSKNSEKSAMAYDKLLSRVEHLEDPKDEQWAVLHTKVKSLFTWLHGYKEDLNGSYAGLLRKAGDHLETFNHTLKYHGELLDQENVIRTIPEVISKYIDGRTALEDANNLVLGYRK